MRKWGESTIGLRIAGLTQRFGDLVAVDGLETTVESGEIVGLVGRNGAGNTTTMRVIMGILQPQQGSVTWQGRPITAADRLRLGYMPEERGLYPQMRVADQVVYFGELHGLGRQDAIARAQQWLTRLGLGERLHDRVIPLSHGNQQRVQLAVALGFAPELLVLDEPFAGLDPSAVDDLARIMREVARDGAAVLFSSHQLDLVEHLCDRVVILEGGRLLAAGTLAELGQRLPRRLRVQVNAPAGWAAAAPGTRVVGDSADGTLLQLGLPGAAWLVVLSLLPPFAPTLMPARLALGTVPAWQVTVAIVLMLAAIYGMVQLAGRIYSRALMHGGERLSWRAAARL